MDIEITSGTGIEESHPLALLPQPFGVLEVGAFTFAAEHEVRDLIVAVVVDLALEMPVIQHPVESFWLVTGKTHQRALLGAVVSEHAFHRLHYVDLAEFAHPHSFVFQFHKRAAFDTQLLQLIVRDEMRSKAIDKFGLRDACPDARTFGCTSRGCSTLQECPAGNEVDRIEDHIQGHPNGGVGPSVVVGLLTEQHCWKVCVDEAALLGSALYGPLFDAR